MLPQLLQFGDMFQNELANKNFFRASINDMRLKFQELQEKDKQTQEIKAKNLGQDS